MGVTLLVGREDDLCCRLVKERLSAAGREFIFLHENELFPGLNFAWELKQGKTSGCIGLGSACVRLDQLDGVFARFSGITTSAEEHATKDGQYLNSEWHALARGLVESLACPVVNRLRPELWYKMRLGVPDIISLAPGQRFRLPRTMVTSSIAEARSFFHRCGKRMRYSPLSLPSDYLIEREEDVEKLEPLSKTLPLALTAVVEGQGLSAFVVGPEVVFDGPRHELAAQYCLDAAASLGLNFCEFELVLTPGGECYCLSIQYAPSLIWCAEETRAAVVEQLTAILSPSQSSGSRRIAA
jgi:hypothetical protein